MRKLRRSIFLSLLGVIAGSAGPNASAQNYPAKAIRVNVGNVPGGSTDVSARVIAQKLSEQLGVSVVIENRPGAAGSIAAERVATSVPDGYTLLMMSSSGTLQSALNTKLPYDLTRDLAPVSLVTIGPMVLVVHSSVPARNVRELLALARSRPGQLNYGANVGGSSHLAGALVALMAKINIVNVPYKGGAEAAMATAAGQVDMSFPAIAGALPLIEAGKLRALAVTTAKRASFVPSIPTLDESGVLGYDSSIWNGLLAPAAVPKDIIGRLNTVVGKVVNTPETKEAFNQQGLEPKANTPEQFAAFLQDDLTKTARLIKLIGLKAN